MRCLFLAFILKKSLYYSQNLQVLLTMTPSQQYIPEVVSRISRRFNPRRIVLFGSHAKGTSLPGSDVDVLVVFRGKLASKRKRMGEILSSVSDMPVSVDCVVTTEDEIPGLLEKNYSIVSVAVKEGKTVYESA
jgi:predicted nucleotidyltransferase